MSQSGLNVRPSVSTLNVPPSSSDASSGMQRPHNVDSPVPRESWWKLELTSATAISAVLLIAYAVAFVRSLDGRWFHPGWTTDDAAQQLFPFHEVVQPGLFEGDLITEAMKGYLPPLHYWISSTITLFTRDPVMTGHWVMLLQVSLAVGFLFMAIRCISSTAPAMLGVLWLLHTRYTMQRMTGGLPRGWTPFIFAAFFYCAFSGRHYAALMVIFAGVLLNPPGTLLIGVAYGALLIWRYYVGRGEERVRARKNLLTSLAVAPLFALIAFTIVQRPPHIGQMVSMDQARQMPEFLRPNGRFPFVPLNPVSQEFRTFGFQAFVGRFYKAPALLRSNIGWVVVGALAVVLLVAVRRRRLSAIPAPIIVFGAASLCTYALSRIFAFRLYVPDRHIQIPMVFFFIMMLCATTWRVFHRGHLGALDTAGSVRDSRFRCAWPSYVALAVVGALVITGSGLNLKGDANFNYSATRRGEVFKWIKRHTPPDALIAGHPTHCDGTQLFGMRRAYATTETNHPFYERYNAEMKRRTEIVLRAHFSESMEELASLVEPEGITHFVFRRAEFRHDNLSMATYFPPLDTLVKQLVTRPSGQFAYFHMTRPSDGREMPFVVFKDIASVVVDVKALVAYLRQRGWSPPQASLEASMQRHAVKQGNLLAKSESSVEGHRS